MTIKTKLPMKYSQALADVAAAEKALADARRNLSQIPGVLFLNVVFEKTGVGGERFFDKEADVLVDELNERDFPMSRNDIAQIFEASGFSYDARHIDACGPNMDEQIDEFFYGRCEG